MEVSRKRPSLWFDPQPQPPLPAPTVFVPEPAPTGLLDAEGRPLYREPEPMGFLARKGQ